MTKIKTNRTAQSAGAVKERKKLKVIGGIGIKRYKQIEKMLDEAYDLAQGSSNESAIELIDNILYECCLSPLLTKQQLAHLFYSRAFAYHGMKNHKDAIVNYNRAVALNPNTEGLYYFDRGRLKGDMGDKKGKAEDFKMGKKIYPELIELFK